MLVRCEIGMRSTIPKVKRQSWIWKNYDNVDKDEMYESTEIAKEVIQIK